MTRIGRLFTVWALLLAVGAFSQELPVKLIKAAGTARVYVMPDNARLSFTVESQDKELAVAREDAADRCAGVIAAIEALNIEGLTLGTESIDVEPLIEMPEGGLGETGMGGMGGGMGGPPGMYGYGGRHVPTKIAGYEVTNSLSVTITGEGEELANGATAVIDTALMAGATSLSGPRFLKADRSEAQREALEKAVKNAVANAEAIARGLGVTIRDFTYAGMYPRDRLPSSEMGTISALSNGGSSTPVRVTAIPVNAMAFVEATW